MALGSSKKQFTGSSSQKQQDEIQVARIPIIGNMLFRGTSASKDQRFVNGIFEVSKNSETQKTHYFFAKRPGLTQTGGAQPPAGSAVGRGVYSWNSKRYSVFGNKIYSGTTDLGVTLTTTTGMCGFASVRPGAGTTYLGINDGVKLYLISTSDVVSTITTNFPTPNTGDLVYMDGYFFVLKTDGTLWSCTVDDPVTWDASKFLTAMMYGDAGVTIARQNNLMVVFLQKSIQFFFDNANATGSPLSNVEQAVQQLGCSARGSVVKDEGSIIWVTNSDTGGHTIYKMDGVTSVKEIATQEIQRVLNSEGTGIAQANAFSARTSGKLLYILSLATAGRTFVFDHETELWTEWEAAAGGAVWPIVSVIEHGNALACQHATNGWIYILNNLTYQDDSTNFTVLARLSRLDFDTTKWKFCKRIDLIGDMQASTTNVSLQYSDDDYVTLSTARTMDMSYPQCFATNLGRFQRRAWQVSYAGNNPLRLEALEVRLRIGDS